MTELSFRPDLATITSHEYVYSHWHVMDFTRIGAGHKSRGGKNQDYLDHHYDPEYSLLVAGMADGMTACRKSDIGAKAAVDAGIALLSEQIPGLRKNIPPVDEKSAEWIKFKDHYIDTNIAAPLAVRWRELVREREGLGEKADLFPYGSTLTLAALLDDASYHFTVGDIVAASQSGSNYLGFYRFSANNDTPSMLERNLGDYMVYGVTGGANKTLLATDGIFELADKPLMPLFGIKDREELLHFTSPNTNDDVSTLLINRLNG